MAFNAENFLEQLNGGKKRKGSCNNKRKKKSCKKSGCTWSKRSKSGAKGHCRKPAKGSRRRSGASKSGKGVYRAIRNGSMGKKIMGSAKKMYRKMSNAQRSRKGMWQKCVGQAAKQLKRSGF